MGYFHEDSEQSIVSAWVQQSFEIDNGYILEAVEKDILDFKTDTVYSGVGAGVSIASFCLMLGLAGFSATMFIPVLSLGFTAITAWNSDCAKGDRELERKFLKEYPLKPSVLPPFLGQILLPLPLIRLLTSEVLPSPLRF